MNTTILKQSGLLSIILGSALGILTTIPFIGHIFFIILMCLASVLILIFLFKTNDFKILSTQISIILGAYIGFISAIFFAIFYLSITMILSIFFQIYTNYGISTAIGNSSFGIIFLFVIFMAVLSATVNAFSGFLTYYGIELYHSLKNDNIDPEEK